MTSITIVEQTKRCEIQNCNNMAVDPTTSTLRARRTNTNFEDSSLKRPKRCIYNYLLFPIVNFHKNHNTLQEIDFSWEAFPLKHTVLYRERHCSNGAYRLTEICGTRRLAHYSGANCIVTLKENVRGIFLKIWTYHSLIISQAYNMQVSSHFFETHGHVLSFDH